MKQIIKLQVLLVLLISHQISYSQTSFTPSLSLRTANLTGKPIDFEVAMTLSNETLYRVRLELERENGLPFRLWDIKANWKDFYTSYFEKTAKGISNLELGYLFEKEGFPITVGMALIHDQSGKVHYMGQTLVEYHALKGRYVKGRKKTIWEGTLDWTVPVRERIATIGRIEVNLGVNLLGRYYKDDKRQFWQAKVAVSLLLKGKVAKE